MKTLFPKSLLTFLLTGSFLLSGCNLNNESSLPQEEGDDIIDIIGNDLVRPKKGEELSFEDFPNVKFYFSDYGFFKDTKSDRLLFYPCTLYLYDVNQDGYRDFCYYSTEGSLMGQNACVKVYDYRNQEEIFCLDDYGEFNYYLIKENGKLVISQYLSASGYHLDTANRLVAKAHFEYKNGEVKAKWLNNLNVDNVSFRITATDGSQSFYVSSLQEDTITYIVNNARVDTLYHLKINVSRENGKYDDLTENLPVSYRLTGDYNITQAKASNIEDNVYINLKPDVIKKNEQSDVTISINVSGHLFNIRFTNIDINYKEGILTLREALGWNFSKDEVTKYRYETISGSYNNVTPEEYDPFVNVYECTNSDAIQSKYDGLDSLVVEVDPALAYVEKYPMSSFYATSEGEYVVRTSNGYIINNGKYYLIIKNNAGDYAPTSGSYLRFRDNRSLIGVHANISGYEDRTLYSLNKIIFDEDYITNSQKNLYKAEEARYSINVAGNIFYIKDATTMFNNRYVYNVVSKFNFSQLFSENENLIQFDA